MTSQRPVCPFRSNACATAEEAADSAGPGSSITGPAGAAGPAGLGGGAGAAGRLGVLGRQLAAAAGQPRNPFMIGSDGTPKNIDVNRKV